MISLYRALFLSWIIPVTSAQNFNPLPKTEIPTGVDKSNPLRVFLLGGQSHCVGTSSVELFNNDTKYEEFQGEQENVWYAGIKKKSNLTDSSRFFMRRLKAGEGSAFDTRFGPEVSLGQRISDALDAPVLIIKYCVGGTSLWRRWNPTTLENYWDRKEDDGTALYLEGRTNFTGPDFMYVNFVYVARIALELLIEEEVPYILSGLFWIQSFSDKRRTWQEYGNDTITLFNTIRSDFKVPDLPVVDFWDVHKHDTHTGKAYAASIIDQCNVVIADWSLEVDDPDKSDSWPSLDGTWFNKDVFDYYGWDPIFNLQKYADLKPPGSSNKIFHWFRGSPDTRHLEYEAEILRGKIMAHTYLKSFTTVTLLPEWLEEDMSEKFPLKVCDHNINDGKPSADNICWIDRRTKDDLADATCTTSRPTSIPTQAPTFSPTVAPVSTGTAIATAEISFEKFVPTTVVEASLSTAIIGTLKQVNREQNDLEQADIEVDTEATEKSCSQEAYCYNAVLKFAGELDQLQVAADTIEGMTNDTLAEEDFNDLISQEIESKTGDDAVVLAALINPPAVIPDVFSPVCDDEPSSTRFDLKFSKRKNCDFVGKQSFVRTRKTCRTGVFVRGRPGPRVTVTSLCPRTCGICPDQCKDSNKKFTIGENGKVRKCRFLYEQSINSRLRACKNKTAKLLNGRNVAIKGLCQAACGEIGVGRCSPYLHRPTKCIPTSNLDINPCSKQKVGFKYAYQCPENFEGYPQMCCDSDLPQAYREPDGALCEREAALDIDRNTIIV